MAFQVKKKITSEINCNGGKWSQLLRKSGSREGESERERECERERERECERERERVREREKAFAKMEVV